MENLFQDTDLAARWGVSKEFVRRASRKGAKPRLKFIRIGNRLRFRESDVTEYEGERALVKSKNDGNSHDR